MGPADERDLGFGQTTCDLTRNPVSELSELPATHGDQDSVYAVTHDAVRKAPESGPERDILQPGEARTVLVAGLGLGRWTDDKRSAARRATVVMHEHEPSRLSRLLQFFWGQSIAVDHNDSSVERERSGFRQWTPADSVAVKGPTGAECETPRLEAATAERNRQSRRAAQVSEPSLGARVCDEHDRFGHRHS
jgi:hypothetical protein